MSKNGGGTEIKVAKRNQIVPELPRCRHNHTAMTHPECFIKRLGVPKEDYFDGLKVGFLDIESSNLKANFGVIFSWYIKPEFSNKYDKYVLSREEILSGEYDKNSMGHLCACLGEYDMIVTYYGKRFDAPFVRTKSLKHGHEFPVANEIIHLDMYDVVKRKLCFHSNRLVVACEYFGIKGKTPIDWHYWTRAMSGDEASLSKIAEHNQGDVDILEMLYHKLKPQIKFTRSTF